MEIEQLNIYLNKIGDESISVSEMDELIIALNNDENGSIVKAINDRFGKMPEGLEYLPTNEKADEVITKIINADKVNVKQNTNIRVIYLKYAAIAASFLAIILVSIYFFNTPNRTASTISKVDHSINNDKLPASNEAVLTLASGKKIILNEQNIGKITEEHQTKIVKSANDQLEYSEFSEDKSNKLVYNILEVPRGGFYTLKLADGSKVWLNAESSINFPIAFTANTREVEVKGEAYFEIAHDSMKPFIVKQGDYKIQVLGTQFNVSAYQNENIHHTTLFEGAIQIDFNNEIIKLKPGQQASLNKNSSKMRIVSNEDLKAVSAWKNGQFHFDKVDEALLNQLARWYNVEIHYNNKLKPNEYKGLISRKLNLSKIIEAINILGIKCSYNNNKIIVE